MPNAYGRICHALVRNCGRLVRASGRMRLAAALAVVALVGAAVPALAGHASGAHRHGGPGAAGGHRGAPATSYSNLKRLARLGRKAPAGTHSPSAAIRGRELPRLRGAQSRTFVRADGTYVTRMFPSAVNFRDGLGRFQPIDNRLVGVGAVSRRQGYAFENAANSYRAFLPGNLSAPVLVAARGSWVSLRLNGADASGAAAGNTGRYAAALPGVDAAYAATNGALKETLTLADANARSSFDYRVHASRDLRARRNADGSVAFVNRRGAAAFVLPAPFVYDRAQRADGASYSAVSQRLTRVRNGYLLRLRVKRSYLGAAGRQFPVTVDPTVFHIENTGDTRLEQSGANVDCYIKDGASADTNVCAGSTQLHLGWDGSTQRRDLLRFDVQNSLPKGIHVLDAELGLYLLDTDNANSATVNLHSVTRSWTGAASWNKYDGTNAWATAGGDFDASVAASNTVGSTIGWYKWFPRQLVQSWIDGSATNNGLLVKEDTERSIVNRFFFNSSAAPFSQLPYLDVVYEPQTGQRPYYKFDSQQLNDRMDLNVNVASGNLMLHASDVNVNGTGLDLGVDRFYNSQLERDTDFGHAGWLLGSGADVRLRITSSEAIFYAPSGYVVSFQKNGSDFIPPKGIDATLCQVGIGGCVGESTYALTYNHAQIRNNFDSAGKLVSQRDQNGNTIAFGYDAGGHLNQITDTQGRTYSVTSNAAGLITQVTDSSYPGGSRTWQYGYNPSNQLTSYTDPEGKVTGYSYDASGELHQITDPRSGATIITYDTNVEERVTQIERVNDNGPNKVTTYAYSSASSPCDGPNDFGKTVVTDANSNATTYCYDDQGRVSKVRDAKGKDQSLTYSANSFVETYTSANNGTSGFNTTVDRDSVSNSVKTITQATGTGASIGSSFTYTDADPTHAGFAPFYPDTAKNPQGRTQTFGYDGNGNLTSVHDDSTPQNQVTTVYVTGHPGWIDHVTDANANTTTYGHDSVGNINLITPPTLAAGTGTQPGTTTVAYDAVARPCIVKDGKGQRTLYGYDKLDRVKTITKYPSSSTSSGCTITSGTASGSVSLTYDNNGNLTQRVDPVGTSTYAYNKLNRLNSQVFPGPRTNTYTYDPVGNLKTLADAGGTVTYGYDADNLLATLTEPSGSCTAPLSGCTQFGYDDDGNRTKTTYPNGNVLTNDYDPAERLTCAGASTTAPPAGTLCKDLSSPLRRFQYTYIDPATTKDTALRQSVTDQANSTTAYGYDNLDRLKTAQTKNSGLTVTDDYTYTYDGAGNLLTRAAKANGGSTTTTTFTYNKANELCWSVTGSSALSCAGVPAGRTTYSYDANGNQTGASNGRAYSYNVFDQATSLTPPGGGAQSATYRGPNQSELVTRGSDKYDYNVLGLALKVHSDTTTSYYSRTDDGAPVGERAPGGSKYYYLFDGLGSVIAMTNSSGAIANTYKYDPYGAIVSSSETTAHPNPFRFAGGLYSSSIALHKFGMRWYDQSIGRWSQQDPIDQTGDLQDGNRYLYVGDDPANATDPTGDIYRAGDYPGENIADELYYYNQSRLSNRCAFLAAIGCAVEKILNWKPHYCTGATCPGVAPGEGPHGGSTRNR
jgi:RHS repeat-associated protein